MTYHDNSNIDETERIRELAYSMNVFGLTMSTDKILETTHKLIREKLPVIQSYLIGSTYEFEFLYVNLFKDRFEELAVRPNIEEFQSAYSSFMSAIRETNKNIRNTPIENDGRSANMLEGIWLMIELGHEVRGLADAYEQRKEFDE